MKKFYLQLRHWIRHRKYYIVVSGGTGVLLAAAIILLSIQVGIYIQARNMISYYSRQSTDIENTLKTGLDASNQNYTDSALRTFFTLPELTYLMSKYWSYSLTVNGVAAKSTVTVKPGNVTVLLTEKFKNNDFPLKTVGAGRVTGGDTAAQLSNYLTVSGGSSAQIKQEKDGVTTVSWNMSSARRGNSYTINLSPMLAEKLNLSSISSIKINVI